MRTRSQKAQAVYDHYAAGSTRGDLYVYFKRGRAGIMKPERSLENALAAWEAGRDAAAAEKQAEISRLNPLPAITRLNGGES